MLDNALKKLLADQLDLAVANAGWTMPVVQKNQPNQEGAPSVSTVFFEKMHDDPFGFAQSTSVMDQATGTVRDTEKQWVQTTFRVSVLSKEDPRNPGRPTAADIANQMRLHMMSRQVARAFIKKNVGLYRASRIDNPYFEDDETRFEAHPGFDIVLTHERFIGGVSGAVTAGDLDLGVTP